MSTRRIRSRIIAVAASCWLVSLIGCGAGPGTAADSSAVQNQIDDVLKQYPEATQIAPNQVAWEEGKVVLTVPESAVDPDAAVSQTREALCIPGVSGCVHGCPKGWYCFYEHKDFGGRMLRFSDCPSGGKSQFLTDYGFGNQTSSWVVNRKLNFVNVNDSNASPGFPSGRNLWNEDGNSQSSYVGNASNDRADWFICYG